MTTIIFPQIYKVTRIYLLIKNLKKTKTILLESRKFPFENNDINIK